MSDAGCVTFGAGLDWQIPSAGHATPVQEAVRQRLPSFEREGRWLTARQKALASSSSDQLQDAITGERQSRHWHLLHHFQFYMNWQPTPSCQSCPCHRPQVTTCVTLYSSRVQAYGDGKSVLSYGHPPSAPT